MQDWGEGYVVDLDYTRGYFRELSPALLRYVALLAGVDAAPAEDFTYVELGCGNGYSTALHAALYPNARFIGADFNPTHIHNARKLAQDAGLENVSFLEKSFAELLDEDTGEADFVTLHGVWSWIGDEHRAQILEFMRRRLKSGGLAYVSYNTLPGLAPVQPLQRLLVEHAALGTGERIDKVKRSMDFAARLQKAGARYFPNNPLAASRLADMAKHDPHYLAHEYYNAHWAPFYHADVARTLGEAKLAYAGSAVLLDNFAQFVITPDVAKVLAEIPDRTLAETIKDYARNQVFRRDVFTRGAPRAGQVQLEAALGRTRFALARPRAACRLQVLAPVGEVTLEAAQYAPVLDALAAGAKTFDEIARSPECASLDRARLRQAIFGMTAAGNVLPALPATGEDERAARAARFNQVAQRMPPTGAADLWLASPVLGAGVPVNLIDRVLLAAPRDEGQAVAKVRAWIAASGFKLRKGEQALESQAEVDAHIAERARHFFSEVLPYLRQLGAVA